MLIQRLLKNIFQSSKLSFSYKPIYLFVIKRTMVTNFVNNRTNDIINLSSFPILYRKENIILHKLFKNHGFELRIAGGAVRDILLNISPHDIDFATNATPAQMIEMFTKENIRILNRNGEKHGTVTVRINDSVNFEVTTLRIDIETDGRHSNVLFTNDWKLDAERRDLTVNSMFLSVNLNDIGEDDTTEHFKNVTGQLFDYFDGRQDLQKRQIRFVGNSDTRIKEDYLRILRYFRFYGRLSNEDTCDKHDESILNNIAENSHGLALISGERCWMELKKILLFPSTPALLKRMAQAGLFVHLGLPEKPNFAIVQNLWDQGILARSPNVSTCLASLLLSMDEVDRLVKRLKISNDELFILIYIIKKRDEFAKLISSNLGLEDELNYLKKKYYLSFEHPDKFKPMVTELLHYFICDTRLVQMWSDFVPEKFPVNGHLLKSSWGLSNKLMKKVLFELRKQWIESDYTWDNDRLTSLENRDRVLKLIDSDTYWHGQDSNIVRIEHKRIRR